MKRFLGTLGGILALTMVTASAFASISPTTAAVVKPDRTKLQTASYCVICCNNSCNKYSSRNGGDYRLAGRGWSGFQGRIRIN